MVINNRIALGYAAACVHGSEGFRATAYLDRLAKPQVWTIGYGTTRIDDRPVRQGDTCTQAQAIEWAAADMQAAMNYVLMQLDVRVNDWQCAALVSLVYNIGMGHFRDSSVLAALNQGHYRQAADCFLEYDHAGGVRLAGLTARRQRERAMFLCMIPDAQPEPAPPPELSDSDRLNQAELDRIRGGA